MKQGMVINILYAVIKNNYYEN